MTRPTPPRRHIEAPQLSGCVLQLHDIITFVEDMEIAVDEEQNLEQPDRPRRISRTFTFKWNAEGSRLLGDQPTLLLQTALVDLGPKTSEGHIIEAVTIPWRRIARAIERNPQCLFEFVQDPWKFEEFIAGAYDQDGWEVTLTPRSGDRGRDVIATKSGHMSIRILDQCKAFSPDHAVTANDVRAMAGVLSLDQNVSKGVVTTTSKFAPGVQEEFKEFVPFRLELRDGPALVEWLWQVAASAQEP